MPEGKIEISKAEGILLSIAMENCLVCCSERSWRKREQQKAGD
jgi:hypothetical protein